MQRILHIIIFAEVATNCDGAAILGTNGKLVSSGVKSFARGISTTSLVIIVYDGLYVWVAYKEGRHVPPGGNYFSKTTFVTGPHGPVECAMIAAAFADFRICIQLFFLDGENGVDSLEIFHGLCRIPRDHISTTLWATSAMRRN